MGKYMSFTRPGQLLLLLVFCFLPLSAQITGDLVIRVTDPTDAVIPGAKVSVKSVAQGSVRDLVTDSQGFARFSLLNIGEYEIRIESQGFSIVSTKATVNTGQIREIKTVLEVSSTRQEVVVEESVLAINTTNAQMQASVDSKAITQLALPNGVLSLAGTTPGVIPVSARNPFLGQGSYNSNGGRGRGNNITIDNANATDVSTTGGAGLGTVPLDAIKEVTVISNNFSAEFGRNSSSQFQLVTKSGTNQFHGSAVHFFRNDKLNARDYFDRTGKAAILRDNNWVVTAGGRVVKDKLFYFGTYEQQKTRGSGGTRIGNVPTNAQVSGITNPAMRQLFTAVQGVASDSGTVSNPAPLGTNSIAYSGKVDWNISSKDMISGRYGYQKVDLKSPGLTFISSNLPVNGASSTNKPQNVTLNYTRVQNASMVINNIASFGRSLPNFTPLVSMTAPSVQFQDATSELGSWSGIPQGRTQNVYNNLTTITKTAGSHTMKFGYNIERIQANSIFDSNVRGTFLFANFAAFQTGSPVQYTQRFGGSIRGNRVWNQGFFFQDDWRVSRTLTLNLGLRTEVAGGVSEVNNIISNLNLDRQQALGGAGTGVLGSIVAGGKAFDNNTNWGPRFGFAWNPKGGKWSVRGGYGMTYDFIFLNPITNLRFAPPFMYNFSTTDFSGANSVANMLGGTSPFQQIGRETVGNFGTNVRNFGTLSPVDFAIKNPQVQQFSLNIERQLGNGFLARVGYVGTKGNFLQRARPINITRPGLVVPATSIADETARRADFLAINAGLNAPPTGQTNRIDPRFTGVTLNESSANSNFHSFQAYLARSFRSGLGFTAAYTWSKSIDDISDVLNVVANDNPSQQNPFDNRNNRAVSGFDVPHRLVFTHSYDLPKFARSNFFMTNVLGGWNLSGIAQTQAGSPVNLVSGGRVGYPIGDPILLGGNGLLRPNLTGTLNLSFLPNPGTVTAANFKTTGSGLEQPLIGNFGSLGRNVIRQNGMTQYDMTIQKNFRIRERYTMQVQSQFANLFNNTSFSRVGASLAAPATFGYYQDTDTNSRVITMVLRFIF